jgi:dolichol-phosphate mannosyltransferase
VSLRPSILICVPTYNERENVGPLARAIISEFQTHNIPGEILFIDDSSPDGTGAEITKLETEFPGRVHSLHRVGKGGLASAYIAGFKWGLDSKKTHYDYVFEMDCDFSHEPQALSLFYKTLLREKPDAVVGSRYCSGGGVANWSEWRYLLSRCGSIYSTFWLRHDLTDWTGGFNCWSRKTLQLLDLDSITTRGYAFQIELKLRTLVRGLRLLEIPIMFQDRRWGESKMGGAIVFEALKAVVSLRVRSDQGRLFSKTKS